MGSNDCGGDATRTGDPAGTSAARASIDVSSPSAGPTATLDLLLRLNIRAAGGDGTELARRTRELLEQFERNEDQQVFLLTIFEVLDERTQSEVDLFDGIKLTLLTEVTQNGVHIYVLAIVDIPLCESSCECRLLHRSKRHHNSSKKQ